MAPQPRAPPAFLQAVGPAEQSSVLAAVNVSGVCAARCGCCCACRPGLPAA
jgi:hypothetical protein